VLPRLAKGLLILALTISLGAHWAFLQSIAWAGMLYSNAQETTLSEAVTLTFSGNKPCSLCKAIEKGKAQERQAEQETIQPSKDLKLELPLQGFELRAPVVECPGLLSAVPRSCIPPQPDAPPPRIVSS